MEAFLTIIVMIVRFAGIVLLACDAWSMKKEYNKQNLVGTIYWGFMMLWMAIMLT